MNFIAIKGRLTHDPDLRRTNSGKAVCSISVAVDRNYTKPGEEKQADFFTCVFWAQAAEFVSKYFVKGQEIVVTGEMQSRKYDDKNGNSRIAWEIVQCRAEFCGNKKDNLALAGSYGGAAAASYANSASDYPIVEDDGELPY